MLSGGYEQETQYNSFTSRCVFKTLPNIKDGASGYNTEWVSASIFAKSFILDVLLDSECVSDLWLPKV